MRILVGLSGGVDSSVAAALLVGRGHEVVGATMKLWGGHSDRGCCSVSDVDDARRSAQQLGVDHHVFNFSDDFDAHVVGPYVDDHVAGRTPNPCIECNRHLKFDRFLQRADALGFDAVATGHHARRVERRGGGWSLRRGADAAKDQSYVLHPLLAAGLDRVLFPVGELTKAEVRAFAANAGLVTAAKADSQDLCFIASDVDRSTFLGDRIPLRPGAVLDADRRRVGAVDAIETVTIGQRRGLGLAGGDEPRYVIDVDTSAGEVTVGSREELLRPSEKLDGVAWAGHPTERRVMAQVSAHGEPRAARLVPTGDTTAEVIWDRPGRRVAPGQSIVAYVGDVVEAGGRVASG